MPRDWLGSEDHIVHFMIALTVGLLLYIVICELAPHALRTDNAKLTIAGLLVGAGVVLLGVTLAGMA